MDIRRLTAVSKSLTTNGSNGYVRVSSGSTFTVGAIVNLTSDTIHVNGLQIQAIAGFVGTTDIAVYLIDPANGAPFNASSYTTAIHSIITSPAQTLWYGVGTDEEEPTKVFSDEQMSIILASILPGGATLASNVAVTNFPASQPVSIISSPLPTNAAQEDTLTSVLGKLNASIAVTGTFWPVTQPISAAALPLPTGAATALAQTDGTQKTQVTNFPVSQPVTAASLPLPTGAATETTLNSILSALGAPLSAVVSGTVSVGNFPADQLVHAASLPLPTGAATEATLAAMSAKLPAVLGQGVMAGSLSVVVASNQSAVPISAASLPLPAGAATSANQTNGNQTSQITGWSTLDANNATSTPLVGGATWNNGGPFTDVTNWSSITVSMLADKPGTLIIDETVDGITFESTSVPYTLINEQYSFCHSIDNHYYRIRYTNGGVAQGVFKLITTLSKGGISGDGSPVGMPPIIGQQAQTVKSILAGRNPPSQGTGYSEVNVDLEGALLTEIHGAQGVFGGLITSQATVRTSFKSPFGINPRTAASVIANTGTVTWSAGVVTLATGLNAAGAASISTREAVRYVPGQGSIGRFATVFGAGVASSRQEVGLLTDTDGFGFGYNGTQFGILIRKASADTWIPQGTWNGDDKFDGTGPSGETLNPQLGSPMQITMQWLGFGAVRWFIESQVTGEFVLVHTYKFANTSTTPSVINPNLPVRAKVINTGSVTNVTMGLSSMGGLAEGLPEDPGEDVRFSFNNVVTLPVGGLRLFTLRNKATNIFGGTNTNTISVHFDLINVRDGSGGNDVYVQLILNPTLTGAVYTDIATSSSVMQSDVASTYTGGTGIVLATFSLAGGSTITEIIESLNIRLAPGEVLGVVGFSETGTASTRAGLSWHEEN